MSGIEGLAQSIGDLREMVVTEGEHAGQSAAQALSDSDFVNRASRWRGGSGERKKIGAWAKMMKIWSGLTGVQPAVQAPPQPEPASLAPATPVQVPDVEEPRAVEPLAIVQLASPSGYQAAPVEIANWRSRSWWWWWWQKLILHPKFIVAGLCVSLVLMPRLTATLAGGALRLTLRAGGAAAWHFSAQVGHECVGLTQQAVHALGIIEESMLGLLQASPSQTWWSSSEPRLGCEHCFQTPQPTAEQGLGLTAPPNPPKAASQTWPEYIRAMLLGGEIASAFWVAYMFRRAPPRAGGVGG